MYNSRRLEKVASLLKKEISLIIMYQLDNNLILENFVSITKVEITADMQYCKILINSSASETTKNQIVEQLNVNKNTIRYYLSQKISMKRVPELIFKKDKFFDEGLSVLKVLDELRAIDDERNQ
tara:strand:+ start:224 stop:595 length:372 start_codon:yes stop_codon:yes gene_type:complete